MTWVDPENPARMTMEHVRFIIGFELGQAPAYLYVDARSKDRSKRERALDTLTARIAARFEHVEILKTKPTGDHG